MAPVAPKTVTFTRRLPLCYCGGGAADDGGDVTGEPGDGLHDLSPMILTGAPQRAGAPAWRTSRSRSGYPYGALALGVLGCERMKRFVCLLELVGLLDGNPERPSLEQSREPL